MSGLNIFGDLKNYVMIIKEQIGIIIMSSNFINKEGLELKIGKFLYLHRNRDFDHTSKIKIQNQEGQVNDFSITFKNAKDNSIDVLIKSKDNDTTRPLKIITIKREDLSNDFKSVKNNIKNTLFDIEELTSESHKQNYYDKLNITKMELLEFCTQSIIDSNKYIDYFKDQNYLVNLINNENEKGLAVFAKSIIRLDQFESFVSTKVSNEDLLSNGVKHSSNLVQGEYNVFKSIRSDVIHSVLDKSSNEYKEFMSVLINKIKKELPFAEIITNTDSEILNNNTDVQTSNDIARRRLLVSKRKI